MTWWAHELGDARGLPQPRGGGDSEDVTAQQQVMHHGPFIAATQGGVHSRRDRVVDHPDDLDLDVGLAQRRDHDVSEHLRVGQGGGGLKVQLSTSARMPGAYPVLPPTTA